MEEPTFTELFEDVFRKNGLEQYLEPEKKQLFAKFTGLFLQASCEQNLTAIRDLPGIVCKHYADCLLGAHLFPANASVLDVGCGGGFPTLPLAIARPDLQITALDSTQKKISFVEKAVKELGLQNVRAVCARVEEEGCRPFRESFDVVTARAVANLRVLSELTLPFVKIGGLFISMKGSQGQEELEEAKNAIAKLGGIAEQIVQKELICVGEGVTESREARMWIQIRKIAHTPEKYPRSYAAIKKGFT